MLPISSNIHVKLVFVLLVQIVIPLNSLKKHLLKIFFQCEVIKMEIDKTLARIRIQNLCIIKWIVTEEEQLTKINLGFEKKL